MSQCLSRQLCPSAIRWKEGGAGRGRVNGATGGRSNRHTDRNGLGKCPGGGEEKRLRRILRQLSRTCYITIIKVSICVHLCRIARSSKTRGPAKRQHRDGYVVITTCCWYQQSVTTRSKEQEIVSQSIVSSLQPTGLRS